MAFLGPLSSPRPPAVLVPHLINFGQHGAKMLLHEVDRNAFLSAVLPSRTQAAAKVARLAPRYSTSTSLCTNGASCLVHFMSSSRGQTTGFLCVCQMGPNLLNLKVARWVPLRRPTVARFDDHKHAKYAASYMVSHKLRMKGMNA